MAVAPTAENPFASSDHLYFALSPYFGTCVAYTQRSKVAVLLNSPFADMAGHEETWEDDVAATEFECAICRCVARDSMTHDCGQLFCKSCWTRWREQSMT